MESNVQKMRKAFGEIQNLADALDLDEPNVVAIIDKCKEAIDLPLRNCDVGTAEEQYRRWARFCKYRNEGKTCHGCPVYEEQKKGMKSTCELIWAQTPYEAEEGGAK